MRFQTALYVFLLALGLDLVQSLALRDIEEATVVRLTQSHMKNAQLNLDHRMYGPRNVVPGQRPNDATRFVASNHVR